MAAVSQMEGLFLSRLGTRTILPRSLMALMQAPEIHGTAQVDSLVSLAGSNRATALRKPSIPSCVRSSTSSEPACDA